MISESTTSCAHALSAELRISAQRSQIRLRQIMDAKLWTKRSPAQVPALHMRCDPERRLRVTRRSTKRVFDGACGRRLAGLRVNYYFLSRSISSISYPSGASMKAILPPFVECGPSDNG